MMLIDESVRIHNMQHGVFSGKKMIVSDEIKSRTCDLARGQK